MFTELHREEKRKEGDRGGQEYRGESKGKRQIQPVISFLIVLHHLEHTKIFTELGREEKAAGGENGESKGEESSQASNLAPK